MMCAVVKAIDRTIGNVHITPPAVRLTVPLREGPWTASVAR